MIHDINVVQCLIAGNEIDREYFKSNVGEITRIAKYYEIPFQLRLASYDKNAFAEIYEKNISAIERLDGEVRRISLLLENNRVDYCVMVGIPFAKRYFGVYSDRLQEDIDFFIDARSYERVCNLMESAGYYKWGQAPSPNRKHQTFIKNGFAASDSVIEQGKIMVKFYIYLTDNHFAIVEFADLKNYIENYQGYRVLSTEASLFHLLLHTHFYDMHPKCMTDLVMLCKNACYNIGTVIDLLKKFRFERVGNIILTLLSDYYRVLRCEWDGRELFDKDDVDICCSLLTSRAWWERVFPFLTDEEMTKWRCYFADERDYAEIFRDIMSLGTKRRVSKRHKGFDLP